MWRHCQSYTCKFATHSSYNDELPILKLFYRSFHYSLSCICIFVLKNCIYIPIHIIYIIVQRGIKNAELQNLLGSELSFFFDRNSLNSKLRTLTLNAQYIFQKLDRHGTSMYKFLARQFYAPWTTFCGRYTCLHARAIIIQFSHHRFFAF